MITNDKWMMCDGLMNDVLWIMNDVGWINEWCIMNNEW